MARLPKLPPRNPVRLANSIVSPLAAADPSISRLTPSSPNASPSRSFFNYFFPPPRVNPDPEIPPPKPSYWSDPESRLETSRNLAEAPIAPTIQPGELPRLVASRVACMRSGEVVLRDMNMSVYEGDGVLLTGPNGSGKSTFLRLLAGFIKPTAGYLMWQGHSLMNPDVYDMYRVNVHLMGAKDAIKNSFTVDDNVRTWAVLEGTEDRVAWALEAVGLKHLSREPASILSMGQRKRLQLARLLAIPRSLWLLDEPSVGLDLEGVALLEGMVEEHRAAGGIAFVATHTPIQLSSCFHLRFPVRDPRTFAM
ncbi:hypothetical protein CLOM_g1448 [Closterium sp. NIES-68]|nr:hypothetical protein CLOM_g1448 [Closterium sp. NIES-68]GJP72871.1 hypothetical protein CLOP_g3634 [Closterium sp. NIES-67]